MIDHWDYIGTLSSISPNNANAKRIHIAGYSCSNQSNCVCIIIELFSYIHLKTN